MKGIKRALLLVGSPRADKSNSLSFGTFLGNALSERGVAVETVVINPAILPGEDMEVLLSKIDDAHVVIMTIPLYVDSLPAPVIRTLLAIYRGRITHQKSLNLRFGVIINCGFPESHHNSVALRICRRFAEKADMGWAGSVSIGMGELIRGKSLDKAGKAAAPIREALTRYADSFFEEIPTQDISVTGAVHRRIYLFFGNLGWRIQALKRGVYSKLGNRPYQK